MGLRPTINYLQPYSHTWETSLSLQTVVYKLLAPPVFHGLMTLPCGISFIPSEDCLPTNFQGIFRKFFCKMFPISSNLNLCLCRFPLLAPRLNLITGFLLVNCIYWIIGISRLSRRATGRGFLDSALSYQ